MDHSGLDAVIALLVRNIELALNSDDMVPEEFAGRKNPRKIKPTNYYLKLRNCSIKAATRKLLTITVAAYHSFGQQVRRWGN